MKSIIDLNLLPGSKRPPEVAPSAIAFGIVMVIAVFAMIPFAMQAQHARSAADGVQQQVDYAEQSLKGTQLDIARQQATRAELDADKEQLAVIQHTHEALQGGKLPLGDALAALMNPARLPAGTRITSITGTDAGFRVEGTASGPLEAIALANNLTSAGGFSAARTSAFAPAAIGGQFTLEVTR
jgi:hypothetical protein